MATAAQVETFRQSYDEVERLIQRDLRKIWPRLRNSNPATIRNVLLELTPRLSDQYGSVALSIAAEWFETVTRQTAVTAPLTVHEAVEASTRALAGGFWKGRHEEALASIVASTTRHALQAGRSTVALSSHRRGMRYARSPEPGACAWCIILASRGPVYHSTATAGGEGNDYHDRCGCTPEPDAGGPLSYDADALYDRYKPAWEAAGGFGVQAPAVARKMRELYGLA